MSLDVRAKLAGLKPGLIASLFRECTPRVLVVTDTLNFRSDSGFGLSQFVATLKARTIHGMTPIVKTASRSADASADFSSYDFNDPVNGLRKDRWDVVFLFGAATAASESDAGVLPDDQVQAIARFMQAGGGVFATGDHETLGAALSGRVPRVRAMRRWFDGSSPPHVSNTTRFSTNWSGANETEDFSDQSDAVPQRLYLNFRTRAGGIGGAHPLMQMPRLIPPIVEGALQPRAFGLDALFRRRVIEVFPDHPHEGECIVPTNLASSFALDGGTVDEWPTDAGGTRVAPEFVAMAVSHGDGFPSGPTGPKQALAPQLFGAIVAYDGHLAGVGRVSTDATWHHFININLDGTGEPGFLGLRHPDGSDAPALVRVRQHFVNLATWLMPKHVRRCLRYPFLLEELTRYPLFEEFEPVPPAEADPAALVRLGEDVLQSAARRLTPAEVDDLWSDALEDALGAAAVLRLREGADRASDGKALHLGKAALGATLNAMAVELARLERPQDIVPHRSFEPALRREAQRAVKRLLEHRRGELRRLDDELAQLERPLAEVPVSDA